MIDYLLYDLPPPSQQNDDPFGTLQDHHARQSSSREGFDETTGLLSARSPYHERHHTGHSQRFGVNGITSGGKEHDPTLPFVHLNALEIAAVADAKKFLSQRIVQKVVNGIWCGDIIFWDSLNAQTKKKAQKYNKRYASYIFRQPLYSGLPSMKQTFYCTRLGLSNLVCKLLTHMKLFMCVCCPACIVLSVRMLEW